MLHLNLKKKMTRNDPPLKNPSDFSDWLASVPFDRFVQISALISDLGLTLSLSQAPQFSRGQCASFGDHLHVDELALREYRREIKTYPSCSRRSPHWRPCVSFNLNFEPVQLNLFE